MIRDTLYTWSKVTHAEGKRTVGWNACGTGRKGGGRGKGVRKSTTVRARVPAVARLLALLFCARGQTFSHDHLENYKIIPCSSPPSLPPSSHQRLRFTPANLAPSWRSFFRFITQPANINRRRRNLRHLHLRRNDFIIFSIALLCTSLNRVAKRGGAPLRNRYSLIPVITTCFKM